VSLLLLAYSETVGALTTSHGSAAMLFETLMESEPLKIIEYDKYVLKTRIAES